MIPFSLLSRLPARWNQSARCFFGCRSRNRVAVSVHHGDLSVCYSLPTTCSFRSILYRYMFWRIVSEISVRVRGGVTESIVWMDESFVSTVALFCLEWFELAALSTLSSKARKVLDRFKPHLSIMYVPKCLFLCVVCTSPLIIPHAFVSNARSTDRLSRFTPIAISSVSVSASSRIGYIMNIPK